MTTNLRIRLSRLAAPVAVVAALGLAAPSLSFAQSADDDGLRQQTVSYADLDLSKDAGMNVALTRIRAAARNVCSADSLPMPLSERVIYYKCMHAAVTNATNTLKASLTLAKAGSKSVEIAAATPIR